MTPDHYAYDLASRIRDQVADGDYAYIRHGDVDVRIENGTAIFSWAYTQEEILRLTANLRVEDIDAIYALVNNAFREGVGVGKAFVRAEVRNAIGL